MRKDNADGNNNPAATATRHLKCVPHGDWALAPDPARFSTDRKERFEDRLRSRRRPGYLEPRDLSGRLIDRVGWNARSRFTRKRGIARQGGPALSPDHRFLGPDQHVHRGLQYFAEAKPNGARVFDGGSNCSECGWSGVEPDGRQVFAPEPECAADDQKSERVTGPTFGAATFCSPYEPLRRVSTCLRQIEA